MKEIGIIQLMGYDAEVLMIKARKALGTVTKDPIDIIVYEQDDFHKRADYFANLEHTKKNEGILIYER